MAMVEYKRATDVLHLVQDINMEVTDLMYIPVVETFGDLSVGISDPGKPGAIAGYMDGAKCKLAIYNGDGTWSPVGFVPTRTPDPDLPATPTLSYLNSTYPDAKPGDIVYRETTTQVLICTCYDTEKWDWIIKNRAL